MRCETYDLSNHGIEVIVAEKRGDRGCADAVRGDLCRIREQFDTARGHFADIDSNCVDESLAIGYVYLGDTGFVT